MKEIDIGRDSYLSLLTELKERIRSAQLAALRSVNRELIDLYWDIGRLIAQRQQGETWGRGVVESLAADLRAEFPGVTGFSAANLWRIRAFYEGYRTDEKLAPLVREISWSKNLVIFERCKVSEEREFYIRRTQEFGWSKNVLIHQIENQTYQKTLLNQTNFDAALPEAIRVRMNVALRSRKIAVPRQIRESVRVHVCRPPREAGVPQGIQVERFQFGKSDGLAVLLSQTRFFDVASPSRSREYPFFRMRTAPHG